MIRMMMLLGLALGVVGCATSPQSPMDSPSATGERWAVATVHPMATRAGLEALERGGNAVDAAVAAALMLGVVDGHNSGIGEGCFILIRRADGRVLAIDGREVAPAGAYRDMYVREGKVVPSLSTTGPLACGVPGALAGYEQALRVGGRLKLADLLRPAAKVAEEGFAIDGVYAERLAKQAEDLSRFAASAAVFLDAQKRPWRAGDVLKQPDLARTYRAIASHGIGWFYGGDFALKVEGYMRDNGGVMRARDLADYRAVMRRPLESTYRGYTVVGFGPPSSGGVHVAQILNILENFELRGQSAGRRLHLIAESEKLAFADRAYWLGDPAYAGVPRGLMDKGYARELAERIDREKASAVAGHGRPPRSKTDLFTKHTTHVAAADAEGNWVALTTTINTSFGSKVVIPGTGVLMNNQMDDFSVQPGVPNAFGLVGAEANAIAPGKRPLSSMSPTIVLKDGRPVLTLGAAGGPTIISQVVQGVVNRLDLGMPLEEALGAGRVHHQWRPETLAVEKRIGAAVAAELRRMGHDIEEREQIGAMQAIAREGEGFVAMHDPRVPGRAGVGKRQGASAAPAGRLELLARWGIRARASGRGRRGRGCGRGPVLRGWRRGQRGR